MSRVIVGGSKNLEAALEAANALIAESADEKAAMQAERDQLLRFNKRINQNETDALVRAEDLGADRDRLAAQVETLTVELDGAHRQFAQEREDWHASDDRCAALQEQLATLRAALEPLVELMGGTLNPDAYLDAIIKAARAALSQTEPSDPPKGDGLACRHCDDRACTFSTPRCETALRAFRDETRREAIQATLDEMPPPVFAVRLGPGREGR